MYCRAVSNEQWPSTAHVLSHHHLVTDQMVARQRVHRHCGAVADQVSHRTAMQSAVHQAGAVTSSCALSWLPGQPPRAQIWSTTARCHALIVATSTTCSAAHSRATAHALRVSRLPQKYKPGRSNCRTRTHALLQTCRSPRPALSVSQVAMTFLKGVHGPTLIQPKVLPRGGRHQVARPRVRDLMCHDVRCGQGDAQGRGHSHQNQRSKDVIRSARTVQPSFSQKCSHVAFVTRLPVHECAISCATTFVAERSPVSSVGVTNVRHGFSMPP